jgi:hypothetical protein
MEQETDRIVDEAIAAANDVLARNKVSAVISSLELVPADFASSEAGLPETLGAFDPDERPRPCFCTEWRWVWKPRTVCDKNGCRVVSVRRRECVNWECP